MDLKPCGYCGLKVGTVPSTLQCAFCNNYMCFQDHNDTLWCSTCQQTYGLGHPHSDESLTIAYPDGTCMACEQGKCEPCPLCPTVVWYEELPGALKIQCQGSSNIVFWTSPNTRVSRVFSGRIIYKGRDLNPEMSFFENGITGSKATLYVMERQNAPKKPLEQFEDTEPFELLRAMNYLKPEYVYVMRDSMTDKTSRELAVNNPEDFQRVLAKKPSKEAIQAVEDLLNDPEFQERIKNIKLY